MLKESDEQWLRSTHPALIQAGQGVAGTIEFIASYNAQANIFVIHGGGGVADQDGAVTLSGSFQIRIEERTDKSTSRLPALYVQGIDLTSDGISISATRALAFVALSTKTNSFNRSCDSGLSWSNWSSLFCMDKFITPHMDIGHGQSTRTEALASSKPIPKSVIGIEPRNASNNWYRTTTGREYSRLCGRVLTSKGTLLVFARRWIRSGDAILAR